MAYLYVKVIDILPKIHKNLLKFKREIITLYRILKKLSRKKMKELKLQQILMSDLNKQFKKLIRTNCIYFINEFFRWNKFFQSKKLFRLKKIY